MPCLFLVYSFERCEAVDPRHSPTDLDLEAYCLTERYSHCPLYRAYITKFLKDQEVDVCYQR